MMLAANEKLSWFISRSSGWVAAALLTLTVMWGVLGSARLVERRGWPRWLADLHRYLAWLTLVFIAVHMLALVGDNYMHIGWRELFVPFALDWRPGAVAWGIVTLYLVAVVQVSSWMRRWLPRTLWRRLHYLSYPAMWMALVHGLRAGTDASNRWVRAGVIAMVAATAFLTVMRILGRRRQRRSVVVPAQPDESYEADAPTLDDRVPSLR
jgi:DMSO/TMAO reductase YedYZ heme-binding membrane subunit